QALDPEDPAEAFDRLYRQRRFDGAGVHLSGRPAKRKHCVEQLVEGGCPFVLIEERVAGPKGASVRADNREGAARAVDHLRAQGHRRMAFLYYADPSWPAIEER